MLTKNEAAKKAKIRKKLRLGSDFVYRYLGRKKKPEFEKTGSGSVFRIRIGIQKAFEYWIQYEFDV